MWSPGGSRDLVLISRRKIAVLVSKSVVLVLVLHFWSWRSVVRLGVIRAVVVLFHHCKLNYVRVTHY